MKEEAHCVRRGEREKRGDKSDTQMTLHLHLTEILIRFKYVVDEGWKLQNESLGDGRVHFGVANDQNM